nr:hypothetical protein [Bacteroidota bacterium]
RMPSKEVYNRMLKKGIRVDKCPYNRNDSLASETDLDELFNVLIKYKDQHGNHPVVTANTIVANPDFDKIKDSGYQEYYYEPFVETLSKYPEHTNSFNIWKKGINECLFYPQFHGREHVNVGYWLKLLQLKNNMMHTAFLNRFWGLGPNILGSNRPNIQATFDVPDVTDLPFIVQSAIEGLRIFNNLFKYKSFSFIANNFIWDSEIFPVLSDNGVKYIQGMKYQLLPKYDSNKRKKIRHYTGERNSSNQTFLVRNCAFEPSENPNRDNVDSCLSDISNAFFWQKPAIISSHRLNYIGFINNNNRNKNLDELDKLLSAILKKWPEVEFMRSTELGELIASDCMLS